MVSSLLKKSEFWYHAEFFDDARLRRLFDEADAAGDTNIQFSDLLFDQFVDFRLGRRSDVVNALDIARRFFKRRLRERVLQLRELLHVFDLGE